MKKIKTADKTMFFCGVLALIVAILMKAFVAKEYANDIAAKSTEVMVDQNEDVDVSSEIHMVDDKTMESRLPDPRVILKNESIYIAGYDPDGYFVTIKNISEEEVDCYIERLISSGFEHIVWNTFHSESGNIYFGTGHVLYDYFVDLFYDAENKVMRLLINNDIKKTFLTSKFA